jgi:hypothetical protein
MKKVIVFIAFVVCNLTSYSQYERVNWIFFIDGKIPFYTQFWGEFVCFEDMPNEKIIKFEYTIGDIEISTKDLNYIRENADTIKLTMKLYYKEWTKKSRNLYIYSFYVPPSDLELNFMVFNIKNLNKKKGTFQFGYKQSNSRSSIGYRKEPRIFTEFDFREGIFQTSDTIIMKEVTFPIKMRVKNKEK